jgi:hypothetical protein
MTAFLACGWNPAFMSGPNGLIQLGSLVSLKNVTRVPARWGWNVSSSTDHDAAIEPSYFTRRPNSTSTRVE